MKSQNKINIFLSLILIGIVIIIFLVAKQTNWERDWFLQIIEQNAILHPS